MSNESDALTLGLMTKYWDVGKVKTRLGDSIGMESAARLHKLFVTHLCGTLADVADLSTVCLSPDDALDRFLDELGSGLSGWEIIPQGDGDLGDRIQRWFTRYLDQPDRVSRAVLIGADCPLVKPELIALAGRKLKDYDVVIGPAVDGGYYLVGLRGPWKSSQRSLEPLFQDIPWSTSDVLTSTKQRAEATGLSLYELPTLEDVDTIAELNRIRESLVGTTDPEEQRLQASMEQVLSQTTSTDVKEP